jgi:Uma2 family endonuclease
VCPPELRVLAAPFAVRTDLSNEVQPDVIVTRYVDLTAKNLPVPPLLAVEALSPSTRLSDLNLKRAHYERLGVPSYWILDPVEPGSLTVHELSTQGGYVRHTIMTGDEVFEAERPFPVTVVPARLLDGLRPSP